MTRVSACVQIFAVFLVFALQCTAAQQVAEPVRVSGYPERDWALLVFYTGLLALILLVIVLLLRALRGEEPDEVFVRMLSVFLIVMIAAFSLSGGVQWLGQVSGIDGIVYQRADSFLDQELEETMRTYVRLALLVSSAGLVASVDLQVVSLDRPLKPVLDLFDRLLDFGYVFLLSISLHKTLLEFGHRYAMSTLFPVGVVLWVFPWTRKAGSFMVAVALALWLVFPFTVILILKPAAELVEQDPSAFLDLPLDERFEALLNLLRDRDLESFREFAEAIGSSQPSLLPLPAAISLDAFWYLVEAAFNWWAQNFMVWLLVPVINVALLMAVVSSIAEALGGEGSPFNRVARYIFPR